MSKRPVAIDLFSGAGGMSLGFEQAGFDVGLAVELDPIHAATHHYNFPLTQMIAGSVVHLNAGIIRERLGPNRSVDVICGGAPCQGFSLIGQRMLDDPRNLLVRHFVRLVVELEAKYFVFENVKGLTLGKHRKFLLDLISEFEGQGYSISQPWQVLNASHYGVPQTRERLFLIGAKRGYKIPVYPPVKTFEDTSNITGDRFEPVPTCKDALDDLPDIEKFEELKNLDSIMVQNWTPISNYAGEMHCVSPGCWHFGYKRRWVQDLLTSSMRTDHTQISRRRFEETPHNKIEPISRFFKLAPDGQSNTLRAGTDSARGAFTSPRPIHYRYPRCISVREMARLHGYPDWFRFHITKWHGARQIGNSVPPPLARAIASRIIEALGHRPSSPKKIIDLGEIDLLSMDMTAAARYWNIDVPIGKRDRKSTARKRKQSDIEAERVIAGGVGNVD